MPDIFLYLNTNKINFDCPKPKTLNPESPPLNTKVFPGTRTGTSLTAAGLLHSTPDYTTYTLQTYLVGTEYTYWETTLTCYPSFSVFSAENFRKGKLFPNASLKLPHDDLCQMDPTAHSLCVMISNPGKPCCRVKKI